MPLKLSIAFLIKTGLLLSSIVLLTVFALLSDTGLPPSVATIATLACAGCAWGLLWSAYKYQCTVLSVSGIEQITMKGWMFVRWSEIKEVRMYSKAFLLDGPSGTVLVYPNAYEQPYEVSQYVVEHLRPIIEAKGAQVLPQEKKKV